MVDQRIGSLNAKPNGSHRSQRHGRSWRRSAIAAFAGLIGSASLLLSAAGMAMAETRSLDIYHMHTGEHETIVFKRDGVYDEQGLAALNHILRDWRRNETIKMDPALFDLIYEVYRDTGAHGPIQIVCGYRAPETNNMLRARSRGVAKFSQHTLGKAMDFFLPGVPLEKLREVGMKKQVGGVGFYPTSGSPFVHMDTGGVRAWPRMSHDQLVRLFPDGKTLHLPSDGGPLPGYNQALAEYQQRKAGHDTQVADNSSRHGKGIAAFFGLSSGDDEEDTAPARAPAKIAGAAMVVADAQSAQPAPRPNPAPLPEPQQLRSSVTDGRPHLLSKPGDVTAANTAPDRVLVPANVPLPPQRPQQVAMMVPPTQQSQSAAPLPTASSQPATAQPGSLMPLPMPQAAPRAPGAIMPAVASSAPASPAQNLQGSASQQMTASLKPINVPVPIEKPEAVIGSVPRPRPPIVTAGIMPRPIDDAFSALTGTPHDPVTGTLLGYAPIAEPPGTARQSAAEAATRMKLASLGNADVTSSLPPQTGSASANIIDKQSRGHTQALAKGDRGDPMARLVSFVTDATDVRLLTSESSQRSLLVAKFVHPDQDNVSQMIVKPKEVLVGSFGHTVAPLNAGHFAGPAVVALNVVETK